MRKSPNDQTMDAAAVLSAIRSRIRLIVELNASLGVDGKTSAELDEYLADMHIDQDFVTEYAGMVRDGFAEGEGQS